MNLIKKPFGNDRIDFFSFEKSVKYTADAHNTDIFTLINILDGSKKYSGVRDWFRKSAKKFWKPEAPKFESNDRESAEEKINFLPIIVTGARPKEVIIGTKTQSNNAIMKIYSAIIPPKTQVLDNIRGFEDLWNRFINKLGIIPYFSDLSKLEREMWLEYYQSDEDLYLEDIPNLEVEILSFGNSDFLKLDEENLEILGGGENLFPMREIVDIFPGKPGSEGLKGRHTLMFRRGIWKVSIIHQEIKEFSGISINLGKGVLSEGSKISKENKIVLFDNFSKSYQHSKNKFIQNEKQNIAVVFPENRSILDEPFLIKKFNLKSFDQVKISTRNFTAAAYKSLLQKTIRFRPVKIDIGKGQYIEGEHFLKCIIILLMLHPGSFVPDIQRFVSGIESVFKRVVVTLFEDSYIFPEDEEKILSVITGALLAQRLPGWKPDIDLVEKLLQVSCKGYSSSKAFIFDTRKKLPPYVLKEKSLPLESVSSIVDELKSFYGDLIMIRDIVSKRYSGKEEITEIESRPDIMPLYHCVDQHWAPEIAYMYPVEIVEKMRTKGNQPFSGLFVKLFSEVTGVNPRRPLRKGKIMEPKGYTSDFEKREFTKITRKAQRLVLKSKQFYPCYERTNSGEGEYLLNYELDEGWISGLLGVVEIKGRPSALVTIRPDNPNIFVAIRKPSRDMKNAFLSDERETEVIEVVKKQLKKGMSLDQSNPPIPDLIGSKLTYNSHKLVYYIKLKNDKIVEWNKFRKGNVKIQYVTDVFRDLETALEYSGNGIVKNSFSKLEKAMNETNRKYIQKAITYIGTKSQEFEFKRIGRDGSGTQGVISIEDIGAYHFVMKVKLLFPSCLKRVKNSALKFRIKLGPLAWLIKDKMIEYLRKGDSNKDNILWGNIGEKSGRLLWEHQVSAIEELQRSHNSGKKGNFIWGTVGSGKSLIALSYLKWLIDINFLPKYVFYTLPSSATKSVIEEIERFGFKHILLVPLKNIKKYDREKTKDFMNISQGCNPLEYTINLIEHDHLRLCEETLVEYMGESIFIIDEVHKALNDTKRTAVSLQLSHLSLEFVAMTGTPIIDSNTYKLIWWLEQIVPFEVNEKNFWAAANGMISKIINTGVEIDRKEIYVSMYPEEEEKYQTLTPESIGGKNSYSRPEDLKKAVELCYSICDRGIINEIQKFFYKFSKGVFVVAKDNTHQILLRDKILREVTFDGNKMKDRDIFLIRKGESIFLTDTSVKEGKFHDYKVVITTIRQVEGYTLTRMNVMISSVYPSNNASREQVEGRINRIGQSSKTIYYRTIHTGILTYILHHHIDARNLSSVLATLADEVKNFS